jgi:glutamate dehydrogenase
LRDVLLAEGRIATQTDPGIEDDATLGLRPQLAVLLGHEKNRLHERLTDCRFPLQDSFSDSLLSGYFPSAIRRRYAEAIDRHPLATDIMHTMAANHAVNHLGLGSVHHLESLLDGTPGQVVVGLLCAEYLLDGDELRHMIWQQGIAPSETFAMQRRLQELQLRFAEDLLRLCPVNDMDESWLRTRRTALARYARSRSGSGEADDLPARLAILPELSRSAPALYLSADMQLPLDRALNATQVCHDLLPLQHMQAALRTHDWSNDDVSHALRCERLGRLNRLRTDAIRQLLQSGHRDLEKAGLALWSSHRYWPVLHALQEKTPGEKIERMELLLLLSRCESLLSEGQQG